MIVLVAIVVVDNGCRSGEKGYCSGGGGEVVGGGNGQ